MMTCSFVQTILAFNKSRTVIKCNIYCYSYTKIFSVKSG